MEVEAVDEGMLAKIVVPEGTADVPVNEVIGVIAAEGEDAKAVASGGARPRRKAAGRARRRRRVGRRAGRGRVECRPAADERRRPTMEPCRPGRRSRRAPRRMGHDGARVFASPLARRIAKEAGIDLAAMTGSGPHGRIVERDVQGGDGRAGRAARPAAGCPPLRRQRPRLPPPRRPLAAPASGSRPALSDEAIKKMFAPGSFTEVPHDGMRKTIARRLVEAKQTIPHFYLTVDCELDALLALREQINAAAPKDKDGKPGLQGLGQRLRHQGAGAGADARAGRQRHLDRGRHAEAHALPMSAWRCRSPAG